MGGFPIDRVLQISLGFSRFHHGKRFVTTAPNNEPSERKWLTLGLARTLLGINEATLRQWADNGLVRAFRTPGGHRRFSAEDIYALMENGSHLGAPHVGDYPAMLDRIRRQVRDGARPASPAWMARFDEDGHARMRELGREFVELATAYMDAPQRRESLREAGALGEQYGAEIARNGLSLAEAMSAFTFFRHATVAALRPSLLGKGATAEGVATALEHLARLADEMLVGLSKSFASASAGRAATGRGQ
jgi:excisionase family DNA binding protein